jgi:hypothetical protein
MKSPNVLVALITDKLKMSRHSTTIGASCEVCDRVGGVENELKSHSVIYFIKSYLFLTCLKVGLYVDFQHCSFVTKTSHLF